MRDRKFKFQVEEINNALIVSHSIRKDMVGEDAFKITELTEMFQLLLKIIGVKASVKLEIDDGEKVDAL